VRAWLVLAPLDRLQRGSYASSVATSQQKAASSRATATATIALRLRRCCSSVCRALEEAPLGAPGNLDHARVLVALVNRELVRGARRAVAVPANPVALPRRTSVQEIIGCP